ncbi:uncharacterized protein PpBr36_09286 [Pyricularia pennisetigena]|uniref:uncharacterized protein n=1 Tax=Pyricularia pennisetigena TaxID=1578925 RepID=UPI00115379E6|nr:uncharacterized protein PpBr36_09286 [Pyricularia pennisetigena]TLS21876.1 hypothetical protein PpBr36_09286 [Pyricularia pennisetigena]
MARDEPSPAQAAKAQALADGILTVVGITPPTLSEDEVRGVWAFLIATQREGTTAATRRQTDRLRAIDGFESAVGDLRMVCNDAVYESEVGDTRAGDDGGNPCPDRISKTVPNFAKLPVKMVSDRSSKLLIEPGVVEELLGRLPVLGPPSDHTPYQVLKRVILQLEFVLVVGAFHAQSSCNDINAPVSF